MFTSDNTLIMILGILLALVFISFSVWSVNKLFVNTTKDVLVRFILMIFASLVFLLCNFCIAQTPIRFCTMEDTCTWRGVSIPGTFSSYIGGVTTNADLPANVPQYSSFDTCYRVLGIGGGGSTPSPIEVDTLLFPNITGLNRTLSYQIKFKLASVAYNTSVNLGAGVDGTDSIKIEWSPNNGLSWFGGVKILGDNNTFGNGYWEFNGSGLIINITPGLIPINLPFPSTYTYISYTSNPVREVTLNLPSNIPQLRIRFVTAVNRDGESFLLDDVRVLAPTILPIQLESFTGLRTGNGIKLSWRTQSETNNDYFSIYKSQHGLEYWELVANIQGAGNSSIPNDYTYIDPYPANGLNYYVLMQTDYDGRREQFPPIVIMFVYTPIQSIWDRYNFLGQEIK